MASLNAIDYAVFAVMLAISAAIGLYYKLSGGRQRTTNEYLLADRQMSLFPVAFSLMASFMSAITLLGVTSENYMFGTQFVAINLSYIIGTPIAAFVFLPVFFRLKITSVYEYLERRFDRRVRIAASLVFMFQMIVYMGIVLYAPALALSAVTGISKWPSIVSVGLVCTLYCTIGGIKAVLWTDVLQSLLMFTAMITVIIKGTIDVGGVDVIWQRAYDSNRIEFFNLDPNPTTRHTFWSLTFGGIFIYISIYGVNQTQVQRLLTVNSLRKSQISLFLSWILVSILSLMTCWTGLVLYAYFWKCDPLLDKRIYKSDQLLPYFVMESLSSYPGLPGIIIAGIFSGALSSVSSFVNSLAAVTLEDYVKNLRGKREAISSKSEILITKCLVFAYGLLCLLFAFFAELMSGILEASLTIFGVVGGPLLMLFTVGMCIPSCTPNGAFVGFISSLFIGLWIGFGHQLYGTKPSPLPRSVEMCHNIQHLNETRTDFSLNNNSSYIYNISYMWYASLTWAAGLLIAVIVSKFTKQTQQTDASLYTPLIRDKIRNNEKSIVHEMTDISETETLEQT